MSSYVCRCVTESMSVGVWVCVCVCVCERACVRARRAPVYVPEPLIRQCLRMCVTESVSVCLHVGAIKILWPGISQSVCHSRCIEPLAARLRFSTERRLVSSQSPEQPHVVMPMHQDESTLHLSEESVGAS